MADVESVHQLAELELVAPRGDLTDALARAQGQFETPKRDKTADAGTYSYTYADLASLIAATRPALTAEGIAVTQDVTTTPGLVHVVTTLWKGDQQLEFGPLDLPVAGGTSQAYGSAITYARRYGLQCALGIATEDDDGQLASALRQKSPVKAQRVTDAQMKALHALAKQKGQTHEAVHAWAVGHFGIASLSELTRAQHREVMDSLNALPDVAESPAGDTVAESPARSEGASKTPSDAAAPLGDGTDQQAGEGAPSPAAGEPANRALWAEADTALGSRPAVITAYKELFGIQGVVKMRDVTTAQLRAVIAQKVETPG